MPLINPTTVMGRAALIRQRCGYLEAEPPYSTAHIIGTCFPDVSVSGSDTLPKHVTEMAQVDQIGQRLLWYNRRKHHSSQRVGIAHGLHHFLTDLREVRGTRNCDLGERQLERSGHLQVDPVEVACDLFAGELLVPFDVLDRYAPATLFPHAAVAKSGWDDVCDRLASMFNVPAGFMRWRLFDLMHLRRTHFFVG